MRVIGLYDVIGKVVASVSNLISFASFNIHSLFRMIESGDNLPLY
jgi:hypothetical protein